MRYLPACLLLVLVVPSVCRAEELPAQLPDLISDLPFTGEHARSVAAGQTITTPIVPVAEGELAIGLACLTDSSATELAGRVSAGHWLLPEDNIIATGSLDGSSDAGLAAALDDMLAGGEGTRYAKAKPGTELNLAPAEYQRLATAPADGALPALVHELVLERFRSYRSVGLAGMAPYARGNTTGMDPGSQLRQSTDESLGIAKYFPSTHVTLLNYPALEQGVHDEGFEWTVASLEKRQAVLLTHTLSTRQGATAVVVRRAFYVSHSLNVLQAATIVHPIEEGTLFVYVYRVWLDRVRGFAGSFAAGIARDIMTREMQRITRQTGVCR